MWVRYDSDRPQYMRAVITGPSGSPYEAGVFVFDFFFPLDYPQVPPKVTFLTTGGGSVRFNPNLYADGKVCLSLLGTYDGPRWMPGNVDCVLRMSQVCVSCPATSSERYDESNTPPTVVAKKAWIRWCADVDEDGT